MARHLRAGRRCPLLHVQRLGVALGRPPPLPEPVRARLLRRGRAYSSYAYPFVLVNFVLLAPLHFLFGYPYEVAHNFLPYFYVLCLACVLAHGVRGELFALAERGGVFAWVLAFAAIGIFLTDPLPWVSLLRFDRDNFHVLAAGAFCYLSTFAFRGEAPGRALFAVGLFLALWSPIYAPAWVLAAVFFKGSLAFERRWALQAGGVAAAALVNFVLPAVVGRLAGVRAGGSGFLYRSGLDGSAQYVTSVFQAVSSPHDPRQWPTAFYCVAAAAAAVGLHHLFGRERRPLRQALFLLIPYATTAIIFPLFTSIHPYLADLLPVVPAIFLLAFWSLQEEFWGGSTGGVTRRGRSSRD